MIVFICIHTFPCYCAEQVGCLLRTRLLMKTVVHSSRHKITQQGGQCTYNVASRRVRATIVCSGKTICITYSGCVFVALGTHHGMPLRSLYGRTIFSTYLINSKLFFSKNKTKYWTKSVCFDFLYNFCPKHHSANNWARNGKKKCICLYTK